MKKINPLTCCLFLFIGLTTTFATTASIENGFKQTKAETPFLNPMPNPVCLPEAQAGLGGTTMNQDV